MKPKINLTTTDKVLETLGWIALIASWIMTVASYSNLSTTIPIHYNGTGRADGFGYKIYIFVLPLVATLLFIGLTILNKFPHLFNYPTPITSDNILQQYTHATRLVRYLKCIIAILAGLIIFFIIQNRGQTNGLGVWFLLLTLVLFLIPAIYLFVKQPNRQNNADKKPKK